MMQTLIIELIIGLQWLDGTLGTIFSARMVQNGTVLEWYKMERCWNGTKSFLLGTARILRKVAVAVAVYFL